MIQIETKQVRPTTPPQIIALIEKIILSQTEYQYSFATVYGQEFSVYSFSHNNSRDKQWYEKFNTNIDVGSTIDVTWNTDCSCPEFQRNIKEIWRNDLRRGKRNTDRCGGALTILNFSEADR